MIKQVLLTSIFFCSLVAAEEVRVLCPMGLVWSNRGHCVKYIDPKSKNQSCPPQSTLSKPNITDDMMCIAKGRCPEITMEPDRFGVCIDKSKEKMHPFPFKQKQNL
jgi:hypothetical protein